METTPLADGDVRWVFPELERPAEVEALLREAGALIEALAERLGVRPSRTGSGLEFCRPGGEPNAFLFGCAEVPEVSFVVDLEAERGAVRRWEVEARISVRCDHVGPWDCGHHIIEERSASFGSPAAAARGLVEAAAWLRERCAAEPLSVWRERDDEPGERRSVPSRAV
ncbi:hypothetical protein ACFYST_20670 [Kitasatospora sp. NPDC004614]|uniref:hypothetical protein n=1 Tax=unclassified Kitasatospora TaxID=2633591 RepID=UPI0036AA1703